jgi:23S rRNA (pseudouridine1915-N3)-methyltransferase
VKIFVYYVGKARDAALNAYAAEFVKRTSRFRACEMREIDPAKVDLPKKHPGARRIYLDPAGKPMDSLAFSRVLAEDRDLVFFIGAHDGLTAAQRSQADLLLSLSAMTFSHELARAVLAEQIFRGFAMLNNHPYVR